MNFSPHSRDAYQMAENTPRGRHGMDCRVFGVGALITEVTPDRWCACDIVERAQKILDKP